MAGFASSFEKAFVPAAKSSSDASLELLKEKIKNDATKAAEKAKVASGKVALSATSDMLFGPNNKFASVIDNLQTPESQEVFSEGLTAFSKLQAENAKLKAETEQKILGRTQDIQIAALRKGFQPATQDDVSRAIVESNMMANKSGKTNIVQLGGQPFVPMQQTAEEKALPASRQIYKDKKTSEIFDTFEKNKVRFDQAKNVEGLLSSLPKGLTGKAFTNYLKNLEPDDPRLGAWQDLKNWLADEQLSFVAKTKGAVSDVEMKFFREAVGNDDLVSAPRFKVILNKFVSGMQADQRAKVGAFKQSFGEDPSQWQELKSFFEDGKDFYVGNDKNIDPGFSIGKDNKKELDAGFEKGPKYEYRTVNGKTQRRLISEK